MSDSETFYTNSTDRPDTPFHVEVTPTDIAEKYIPTTTTMFQLSWRDGEVAVSDLHGNRIGRLPDAAEEIYGDGVRYLEERGYSVCCSGRIEVVSDSVLGNVGLRSDVDSFFRRAVPRSVLKARVRAKTEAVIASQSVSAACDPEQKPAPDTGRRGFLSRVFGARH